jgi:chromate transporter
LIKRIRHIIFLRDVLLLSISAFGGPQAHLALFLKIFVEKRGYLSEKDLIELNALCQVLPGPTSTQTITALGYRMGGHKLAYLTLLIWALPAVSIMTFLGILMSQFHEQEVSINFTRFIQPMAVGFVGYASIHIAWKVVRTKSAFVLMALSALLLYLYPSPFLIPFILMSAGGLTAFKFKKQPIEDKDKIKIRWNNFILWAGVFIIAALVGHYTKELTVRLFENFYRNGSLIFGGGHVLVPLLFTEFVEFKHYLSSEEFLVGFAFVQAVPGPVFSFCSYVGALSMREYGIFGEIAGGLIASAGIFLPGTFLIHFLIRFWDGLKQYRVIRASIEGITAASTGLLLTATVFLIQPIEVNVMNLIIILATFTMLNFISSMAPLLIIIGLIAGLFF